MADNHDDNINEGGVAATDLLNFYANKELVTQQNVPDNHTLIYGTTPYGPVEEVNGAWTWGIGGPSTNGIVRMRYNVRANNPELVPNAVYRVGIKVTPQNSITTRCVDLLLSSGMQFVDEYSTIPPQGSTAFLYFDVRIVDPVGWNFSFFWHVGMAGSNSSQWMYFREPSLTLLTPLLTSDAIGGSFSLGPIPILIHNVDGDNAVFPGQDNVVISVSGAGTVEGLVFWGGTQQPIKNWTDTAITVGPVDGTGLTIGQSYDWEVWRPEG